MRSMSTSSVAVLIAVGWLSMILLSAYSADAAALVHPGGSIQPAIDIARPGEAIEVPAGTYHERINITKRLTLIGKGATIDAGGSGSAITLSADGITLEGFTVTAAGSGANDAGIKVLSKENFIRENTVLKNGNDGLLLYFASNNTVSENTFKANGRNGAFLRHSGNNLIKGNSFSTNKAGLFIETSRGNRITSNIFNGNSWGIYIQNQNSSESIKTNNGKSVSIKYKPADDVSSYALGTVGGNLVKSSSATGVNTIYLNQLSGDDQKVFDDGSNQWDYGAAGNSYSNYNSRDQGCIDRNRDGICDNSYSIPGGSSLDRYPKASKDAILQYKSKGTKGYELDMDQTVYAPGGKISARFKAPLNFSGLVSLVKSEEAHGKMIPTSQAISSLKLSRAAEGALKLNSPAANGTYDLRMYDSSGSEMTSITLKVMPAAVWATPSDCSTCDPITVSFSGAPGIESDWIGMYPTGASDSSYISRQYLNGNINGTLSFITYDSGTYDFRMFENGSLTRLSKSNAVSIKNQNGAKLIATPDHVPPGGTVTVHYWGAPASGTGMMGMYGMTRPDKFPVEKRSLGSRNCGSITWRLPYDPGQYDFRMFYSDITDVGQGAYQILGQTNVVTVG